ncbi:MAG: DUF1501 domain-containing protein [Gemmataceae bacterium]
MSEVVESLWCRRGWLQVGSLGAFGLGLSSLLSSENRPIAGKPSTKRSCILFLLHGGPSQLDTWDMKPHAPDNIRGIFRPIQTRVPGIHISECMPRLAQRSHLFRIVRSMTHSAINHNTATYTVTTGHSPIRDLIAFTPSENDFPHLGAQVSMAAPVRRTVPTAVSLPDSVSDGPYTTPGQNGGFLGAAHAPFHVLGDPSDPNFHVEGLSRGSSGLRDRENLRKQLANNKSHTDRSLQSKGFEQYRERAMDILASDETRFAFRLDREPLRIRETYGLHKYGQSLLLARRLVEAGVRLVTVYWGGKVNNPNPYWDTHFNNNRRLKDELLPPFDECFSAFLDDLQIRGMLETTLILAMGEFGRTPRFGQFTGNGVNETGRDHWSACYSLLLAGGPAGGGKILGKSDRFAAFPSDEPFTPGDLQATVLDALGISPQTKVRDGFGRMTPLSEGRICSEFFGT